MKDRMNLSRRDFGMLSAAAMGGMMAGCSQEDGGGAKAKTDDGKQDFSVLLQDSHACRGLNTCKGKGACKTTSNECKGKNACAGQGKCATAAWHHECGTQNKCKGQGGCGDAPAQNACKGKGSCSIPLMEKAWPKARAAFEKAYEAKHGKKPGAAPTKA